MRPSAVAGAGLITLGLVLLGAGLTFAAAAASAPVDAATVSLAVCGGVLVYALRSLFALVRALMRPDELAQAGRGAGRFSRIELREEKRRLLRAIKELEFDHGMGKLSQEDFDAVIGTYRVRAIEVMRALDGEAELHPELQRLLAGLKLSSAESEPSVSAPPNSIPPAAPSPEDSSSEAPASGSPEPADSGVNDRTSRICAACSGHNDKDARFCKYCGAALPRKGDARERRGGSSSAGEIS